MQALYDRIDASARWSAYPCHFSKQSCGITALLERLGVHDGSHARVDADLLGIGVAIVSELHGMQAWRHRELEPTVKMMPVAVIFAVDIQRAGKRGKDDV